MTVLNHTMPLLNGTEQDLSEYAGKVVLVVNTASKCGFTYQYEGLESMYNAYKDKGLVILGFPCNQFGKQEQGSEVEIGAFCQKNYGVSFPMFSKIEVNRNGEVVRRYAPTTKPEELLTDVETELAQA